VVSSTWKRTRRSSHVSWLLGVVCLAASAQTPILILDKQQFFPDESVRFWIGVSAQDPIPEAVRESGIVHILRPDGTRLNQPVHSPIDGDPSSSYKGGWGLGPGPHALGSYYLSFEYAGKKTEDQVLDIVPNPFEGRVRAFWIYHSHQAVLRVENHTGRMVRFAEPGLMGSELWITVREEHSTAGQLVPESAISPPHTTPGYSFENLNWSNLARWPMVEVPPGQAEERTVALAAVFPFRDNQQYDVKLDLTLTIFVGESSDPEARLFPERRIVPGNTQFRW
jgi:hypothetical protein